MESLFYISLIGFIAGISGTGGGGLIVVLLKKFDEKILTFVLGISAGLMTVIVFFDLIPEAIDYAAVGIVLVGMIVGVLIIAILGYIFPDENSAEEITGHRLYRTGILLALGIAIHNIPEGLAIGASYSADRTLGIGLAVIIGIHNFPEGMAVATSLSLAGLSGVKILLISILAGLPMGVGAFLGAYLGNISDFFLSLSLGFAAGAMLFITFDDLLPAAHLNNKGRSAILGILIGVFFGIYLTSRL
ncbi:ZIP family metal transporter [Natronospora cellulosivora (SeqCode)]